MSGLLYPKVGSKVTPPGFAILGDSAVVVDVARFWGKKVRGRKNNEVTSIPETVHLAAVNLVLQQLLRRECQSANWVVSTFKAPYGCPRFSLTSDSFKGRRLLSTCACLLNARPRLTGLNHITTAYSKGSTDTAPWIARFVEEQHTIAP